MAKYLDAAGLTQLWTAVGSTFLSKSGGAVSSSSAQVLSLNSSHTSGNSNIMFKSAGNDKVEIGYDSTNGAYMKNIEALKVLNITNAGVLEFDGYTILTTLNLLNYATDLAGVWASLQNNDIVTTNYNNYQIRGEHLPTIAGTGVSGTYTHSGSGSTLATTLTLSLDYLPLNLGRGKTLSVTSGYGESLRINADASVVNAFIYFMVNSVAKASVGYYEGFSFIAEENTFARIGLTSSGVPQYWNNSSGGSGHQFNLLHEGNFVAGTNYVSISGSETITGLKEFREVGIFNKSTSGYYNEGIRCNLCNAEGPSAWSSLVMGGAYGSTSGTGEGVWSFCTNQKNFYLGHNGSSGATYGFEWMYTGQLALNTYYAKINSSIASVLVLNSTFSSGTWSYIQYNHNNTNYAGSGYKPGFAFISNDTSGATHNKIGVNDSGVPQVCINDTTYYTLLHANNFSTWALPVNGKAVRSEKADVLIDVYRYDNSTRRTSLNVNNSDSGLHFLLSTSSVATGYPGADGYVIQGSWDSGYFDAQLFLPNTPASVSFAGAHLLVRHYDGDLSTPEWTAWKKIYDEDNLTTSVVTGLLAGATITHNSYPILALNSTYSTAYSYMFYKHSGSVKAASGYVPGMAFVSNEVSGASYSKIGVTDSGNPEFWTNSDVNHYTLFHSGNYMSRITYLTNGLEVSNGTAGNVLNLYGSSSDCWTYFIVGDSSTWTTKASVGYYSGLAFVANETGYQRIGVLDNGTPVYRSGASSTDYTLWHAGNSNLSSVNWSCGNLSAYGYVIAYGAAGFYHYDSTGNHLYSYFGHDSGLSGSWWYNGQSGESIRLYDSGGCEITPALICDSTVSVASCIYSGAKQSSTSISAIPSDSAVALRTGDGNSSGSNTWVWRLNWSSANWGLFWEDTNDIFYFVGNGQSALSIYGATGDTTAKGSLTAGTSISAGTSVSAGTYVSAATYMYAASYIQSSGELYAGTFVQAGTYIKLTQGASSASTGYISAGGGYSPNSGKYGVKVIACDQSDCQTGLGQDCVGDLPYDLSIIGGQSGNSYGYISFVFHQVDSTTYHRAGYFDFGDNFYVTNNINSGGVIFATTGIYSNGYVTAGSAASSSDIRLKENIASVTRERAKEVIMALNPCEWTWNDKHYKHGQRGAGMVAQEVESILPFAILQPQEYKYLEYDDFHAYEIKMLQSHETELEKTNRRLNEAEREIVELKRENAELKSRLNA